MKNHSKTEAKRRKHQSIDLFGISIDFGPQVGSPKRAKTPKKRFKMASKNEAFLKRVFEALQEASWRPLGPLKSINTADSARIRGAVAGLQGPLL